MHQREPTIDEFRGAMRSKKVVEKALQTVTEEEIVTAFRLGEEGSSQHADRLCILADYYWIVNRSSAFIV